MSSRKLAHFAVAFLVAAALSAALATSAFATPDSTVTCSSCHSGAGTAPTVTLVSNNGTTATYSVQQVLTAWAAFDGTTRIAGDETSGGTFTGPVGDTFTVFAVGDYPGPIGETTVTPGGGGATTFTITPTAGANGSISPATTQTVNSGASATFTITPNSGYHVDTLKVDGNTVTAAASYTFTNVTGNHTIAVTFAADATYTLTTTVGAHGTVTGASLTGTPFGAVITVPPNSSYSFRVKADLGYRVDSVLVDGVQAQLSSGGLYTFTNITASHTFSVTFAPNAVAKLAPLKLSGLNGTALTFGKTLTATGSLTPANLGGAVILTLQREVNGKWLAVTSRARTLTASGTYSWTYKPATKGTYRIKTTIAAVAAHTAATTMWTVFSVK